MFLVAEYQLNTAKCKIFLILIRSCNQNIELDEPTCLYKSLVLFSRSINLAACRDELVLEIKLSDIQT